MDLNEKFFPVCWGDGSAASLGRSKWIDEYFKRFLSEDLKKKRHSTEMTTDVFVKMDQHPYACTE